MAFQNNLLDKDFSGSKPDQPRSRVVETALKLRRDYFPIRDKKRSVIKDSKDLLDLCVSGGTQSKLNTVPSYMLLHLIEWFATLIQVPDFRLDAQGVDDRILILLSKYTEMKLRDGGFYELMEDDWGVYRNTGLEGVTYVAVGVKTEGDIGMPTYRMLKSENVSFNPTATRLRTRTSGQEATRFAYDLVFTADEADIIYPGIMKGAEVGYLPSYDDNLNKNELDDEQEAQKYDVDYLEVMIFSDTVAKVDSIIAGENAYEYKTLKEEDYPWKMKINGAVRPFVPVSQFKLQPYYEGIDAKGFGEMFYSVSKTEGLLNSSQANNAQDNETAPQIWDIPSEKAEDVFEQLSIARTNTEETGKRSALVFDAGVNGRTLGQNNISTIQNLTNPEQIDRILEKFDTILRRFGFNLDFFFTDKTKTLGQTELDIQAVNDKISAIQQHNRDFYDFNIWFAVEKIIENGDENSKEPFANDLEVEYRGEEVTVKDLMDGELLTEGDIIKMFRKYKDQLELEVDVKGGVAFNPLLERRNLQIRLAGLDPASPEAVRVRSALSLLAGGKKLSREDLTAPQGQVTAQGQVAEGMGEPEQAVQALGNFEK